MRELRALGTQEILEIIGRLEEELKRRSGPIQAWQWQITRDVDRKTTSIKVGGNYKIYGSGGERGRTDIYSKRP